MFIRPLIRAFDPVYIKPNTVANAVKYLLVTPLQASSQQQQGQARCNDERRLGDRRQRRTSVLLDLRSPHARRHAQGRRDFDATLEREGHYGIDVYA